MSETVTDPLLNRLGEDLEIMSAGDGIDPHEVAADPAEDHKTPGGQPGDNAPTADDTATETTVETPGGTTVTETPIESGDDGE